MPTYRKVFPSYDWDDVVMVNQIVYRPEILSKEELGFKKAVPNEEVKLGGDDAIEEWIENNMKGCSCFILFVGEKTYLSR